MRSIFAPFSAVFRAKKIEWRMLSLRVCFWLPTFLFSLVFFVWFMMYFLLAVLGTKEPMSDSRNWMRKSPTLRREFWSLRPSGAGGSCMLPVANRVKEKFWVKLEAPRCFQTCSNSLFVLEKNASCLRSSKSLSLSLSSSSTSAEAVHLLAKDTLSTSLWLERSCKRKSTQWEWPSRWKPLFAAIFAWACWFVPVRVTFTLEASFGCYLCMGVLIRSRVLTNPLNLIFLAHLTAKLLGKTG